MVIQVQNQCLTDENKKILRKKQLLKKSRENLIQNTYFYVPKNEFYEGRLKNYSRHGLFIETEASLSVGEIIKVRKSITL